MLRISPLSLIVGLMEHRVFKGLSAPCYGAAPDDVSVMKHVYAGLAGITSACLIEALRKQMVIACAI